MSTVSAFMTGNYPRQPALVHLLVKSINLSFMVEFKSDVSKDISSAKMSHSFTAANILMKRTFLALVPFYFCSWEAKVVPCFFSSW